MAPRKGDAQEGEGEEEKGRGKGKIVATRCQILWLKCEDALYKCTYLLTYLLTYISSTIGCANFGPYWPLLFIVHEI